MVTNVLEELELLKIADRLVLLGMYDNVLSVVCICMMYDV